MALCPFAQRSRMVLAHKGIDYDLVEVDIFNKPSWFSQLNPREKVPVLKEGDFVLYESSLLMEYLEEAYPQHSLMPQSAKDRATARLLISLSNNEFIEAFYGYMNKPTDENRKEFEDVLQDIDRELGKRGGPFFMGQDVSLADFAFVPFYERITVLEDIRGYKMDLDKLSNTKRWLDEMGRLPAWSSTKAERESLTEGYRQYLAKRAAQANQ
jgi:glutathione S-transferase